MLCLPRELSLLRQLRRDQENFYVVIKATLECRLRDSHPHRVYSCGGLNDLISLKTCKVINLTYFNPVSFIDNKNLRCINYNEC